MIKAKVSLTLENEHGEVTENVYECEGENIEEVETKLVTQVFIDSGAKVVDKIYEMALPAPKPKRTRSTKKKPAQKQLPAKVDDKK